MSNIRRDPRLVTVPEEIRDLVATRVREFGPKRFGLPHPRLVGVLSYYLDDPSKRHQLSAALAVAFKVTR